MFSLSKLKSLTYSNNFTAPLSYVFEREILDRKNEVVWKMNEFPSPPRMKEISRKKQELSSTPRDRGGNRVYSVLSDPLPLQVTCLKHVTFIMPGIYWMEKFQLSLGV